VLDLFVSQMGCVMTNFFSLSSYSHLLPNDDEAFEHFDSFISRRIDEVGIPYKFVTGQGE